MKLETTKFSVNLLDDSIAIVTGYFRLADNRASVLEILSAVILSCISSKHGPLLPEHPISLDSMSHR